jgi:DNA mismatch endonuclease, patch repair protein
MADVHDRKTRSYNMSQIKGKNTQPEILVRKFLFAHGFRYRLHNKKLPGNPDIIFPKYKIVIFINGCFFHRHKDCKLATKSKTHKKFWNNKIEGNVLRDKKNLEILTEMKWTVINLWECEIEPRRKKSEKREATLKNLERYILELIQYNDTCN